jgi:DNA-binding transcriptional LysR family regulator
MELRQLEAFVVVADELHFGRAAQKLHIGQPTLSDLVRRLERDVGTPLLTRTTRRVTLTNAGAELRQRAIVILGEVAAAATAMHRWAEGDIGNVQLGITPPVASVLAPHIAATLHRAAPSIDLVVRRMWLPDLERALADGTVDVGITCGRVSAGPGVTSELLCGEPWLVGLRPSHPLAGCETLTLADLVGQTLGMHSETLFPAWTLAQRQALSAAGVDPAVEELFDTDLSASRWTSQSDVDWILTTASIAGPHMSAFTRPLAPAQLLPFTLMWAAGRIRNPAVSRLVRLTHTVEMPPGWVRFRRASERGPHSADVNVPRKAS